MLGACFRGEFVFDFFSCTFEVGKPMTRIEPYWPPRPTIRKLLEGRPARADDGGISAEGYLGRPPKSAYRTEDRAEAERRVGAREIQPWRGEEQRRAHGTGEQH